MAKAIKKLLADFPPKKSPDFPAPQDNRQVASEAPKPPKNKNCPSETDKNKTDKRKKTAPNGAKKSPEKRSGRATRKLKNIRPQQRTEKAPKKKKKPPQKTQQKNHQNHPKNTVPKSLKIKRIGRFSFLLFVDNPILFLTFFCCFLSVI